jgi:hypothetical protein
MIVEVPKPVSVPTPLARMVRMMMYITVMISLIAIYQRQAKTTL